MEIVLMLAEIQSERDISIIDLKHAFDGVLSACVNGNSPKEVTGPIRETANRWRKSAHLWTVEMWIKLFVYWAQSAPHASYSLSQNDFSKTSKSYVAIKASTWHWSQFPTRLTARPLNASCVFIKPLLNCFSISSENTNQGCFRQHNSVTVAYKWGAVLLVVLLKVP